MHLKLTIEVQELSIRLDRAILQHLQKQGIALSRGQLKVLIQESKVLYQDRPVSGSFLLSSGSHSIAILRSADEPPLGTPLKASPAAASFQLPIIYEDENLFLINKTSGVPSLPHEEGETETAVNFALARLPELAQIGRKGLEPGLLHRLDTQTSGLLLFAKNQNEFDRLSVLWKRHSIQKIYRALAKQTPTPLSKAPFPALPSLPLTLDIPLGHHSKSSKKMIPLSEPDPRSFRGKPLRAITHLLKVKEVCDGLFDFEIQIETGVMHQIRCHLSSIGWPLWGDTLYQGLPSNRIWLHAWRLKIPLKNGTLITFEAMLPPGWVENI